jgi:hypothetical protein
MTKSLWIKTRRCNLNPESFMKTRIKKLFRPALIAGLGLLLAGRTAFLKRRLPTPTQYKRRNCFFERCRLVTLFFHASTASRAND